MKQTFFLALAFVITIGISAQGYKVGDKAIDFKLKNIDDKMVSLSDYKDAKGFVVIFTCNHCPYAVAYEDRIVELDKAYKGKGFPVIAINPNDPKTVPSDSFDNMKKRAKEKKFTFPYLVDETQQIAKAYGATKTPHVYILQKKKSDFIVEYIGTIDDNYSDAESVNTKYIEEAINQLLGGNTVAITETKAIGCSIKWKN